MWQCCDFVRSRLTDWLTDWLANWLANWLTDWLTDWPRSFLCTGPPPLARPGSRLHTSPVNPLAPTTQKIQRESLKLWDFKLNNCTHKALNKTGSVKHAMLSTWWIFASQHTCIFLSLLSISFFPGDLLVVSMTLISCKVIAGNFGNTKFIYLLSQGNK